MEYDGVDLFIDKRAALKMLKHCRDFKDMQLEVMGFMVGHRYHWGGREHTVVEDVVTSDLNTTAISVKFASFEPLFAELDRFEKEGKDYILVGWYHSHPGHTCFMSPTDKDTQIRMFNKKFQSAVVIDPINIEMKAFQLFGSEIYEKPYAIITGPDTLEGRKLPRIVIPEEVGVEMPVEEFAPAMEIPIEEFTPAVEIPVGEFAPAMEIPIEGFTPARETPVEEFVPAREMPVEEFVPAREMPVEEFAPVQEMPVEEFIPAQEMPVEEFAPAPEIPVEEFAPAQENIQAEMRPRTARKIRRVVRHRIVRKRVKRRFDEAEVIW